MRGMGRSVQLVILACFAVTFGCSSDDDEPEDVVVEEEGPFPADDDPSAFTGPVFGDLAEDLPHTNQGSFEGGVADALSAMFAGRGPAVCDQF